MTQFNEAVFMEVQCDNCKAMVDARCTDISGNIVGYHAKRRRAWKLKNKKNSP